MTAALPQRARSFGASLLRRYGFRRVLLVNGTLTALIIVGCPARTPSTPYTVIAIVLFASGLTRSLQFSAANTLANVVQQLTLGFGVAAAAAAVRLAALLIHDAATGPTLTDFRTPIMAAAIMAAVSTLDALALSPDAGSLVSGHRRWENDGVTQSFSEITVAPSIIAGASTACE
jgi:hypothetical protein